MNEEALLYDDVVTHVSTEQTGLMDTAREYLNPQGWLEKCNLSKQRVIELSIYFVVGFALGFFIKKYSKALYVLTLIILGLVALHYFDIINVTVNVSRIKSMLGIEVPPLQTDTLTQYFEWAKTNIVLVVSIIAGFLLGLKVA